MQLQELFALRGKLPRKTKLVIEIGGMCLFLLLWSLIAAFELVPPKILPPPLKVLSSFYELHFEDALVRNALYSLSLNLFGLLEAAIISIPIGFLIGLYPIFKASAERSLNMARYVPLTAFIGIFVAWFGIDSNMKVQFLAAAIVLYLIPVVVQRVEEVEEVYVQTVKTLGATQWQAIRTVFIPSVLSRVYSDIVILAALSWTYIVVAEMVNSNGGGIGALSYIAGRQSRTDKVYALVLTIVLIGYILDKAFILLDRIMFGFKYVKK